MRQEDNPITVDLDWPTKMEIVSSWHYLESHGNGRVTGRVSSGGHGVHIRAQDRLPHPCPVNEHHRRMAGDDITRLRGDIENDLEHNQVFFTSKQGRKVGRWVESIDLLLSEYDRSSNLTPEQYEVKNGNTN